MIHKNIYIPATIKVGKGPNELAAVTFKDVKRAWVKPANFQHICGFPCIDSPRDPTLVIRRDISNCISVHDNNPISGFKLASIGNNCVPETSVFIEDPRGWQFRISLEILIDYLRLHRISIGENGEFSGDWCYCFDGENIIIINSQWDEYRNGVNEKLALDCISNIKTSMNRKNLKVGSVYKIYTSRDLFNKNYERAVYLGEYTNGCSVDELRRAVSFIETARRYYYRQYYSCDYVNKATKMIQKIMNSFSRRKMVFMYLNDMICRHEIKYDGTKFYKFMNEPLVEENYTGKHQRLFKSVYVDEILENHHDFSFKFDPYYNNNFYITQNIDPLIVRGLDEDQKLVCTNKFENVQLLSINKPYKRHSFGARYDILHEWKFESDENRSVNIDEIFNKHSEYTLAELQRFAKYCCDTIIPDMVKTINDNWLPTHR